MLGPRRLLPGILMALVGCSDSTDQGRPEAGELGLLSNAAPVGTGGWALPDSVVVEVLDAAGNPLPGVAVRWVGVGQVSPATATTDNNGRAATAWTLGLIEGTQALSITTGSLSPLVVVATAQVFHAQAVSVGVNGFACALDTTGRAYCWGYNRYGQLGNGTVLGPSELGDMEPVPQPVSGDLKFGAISAGGTHVCALSSGLAYCWGSNQSGETGTGISGSPVPTPTPVVAALQFTQISAEGHGEQSNSTCGVTPQGEVWCWGDNRYAKLGDGTEVNSAEPHRVQSSVLFTRVETGFFHACALTQTGELWCWGEQETDGGGLGNRPAGLYTAPIRVAEGFEFKDISLGRDWTCGLDMENQAYCWGTNWFGALGTDLPIRQTLEPLPVAGRHLFRALSAPNMEANYALTVDGTLYRWGATGGDAFQAQPVAVAADLEFTSMDPGEFPFLGLYSGGSCGVHVNGAVYCVRDDGLIRGVPVPLVP